MALPSTVAARALFPGDLLGLKLAVGSGSLSRIFWFRLDDFEFAKLADFSLGTASAQAAAGTGVQEIFRSGTNQSFLEPDGQGVINQFWWGAEPKIAWIYSQYPPGRNRSALVGQWSIGDQQGYIAGYDSPYNTPAPETETYTVYGLHPGYNGYHPFFTPASITVRMTFWVYRFAATLVSVTIPGEPVPVGIPGVVGRTVTRTVGGLMLAQAPLWITDLAARNQEWAAKLTGAGQAQPMGSPTGGVIRAESPAGWR